MKIKGFKDTLIWYEKNAKYYSKKIKPHVCIQNINDFSKLLKKNSLVLDAGCAGGRDSYALSKKGLKIIGVDLSKKLINIAKKTYPKINFIIEDFRKLAFKNNYFDGIFAQASLVHFDKLSDINLTLKEFYRVLKKNGVIFVSFKKKINKKFNIVSDSLSNHERFFNYFTESEIEKLIKKNHFKIIKIDIINDVSGRNENWIICFAKK